MRWPGLSLVACVFLVVASACSPPPTEPATAEAAAVSHPLGHTTPLDPVLRGVTLTTDAHLTRTLSALRRHRQRLTYRLVMDVGRTPASYLPAVRQLSSHGTVMGQLLDSSQVKAVTVAQYRQRTVDALASLGPHVGLWEIGNEVNGEWLGSPDTIVAKITAAYDAVQRYSPGTPTALTFNYWHHRGCYAQDWEHYERFARRFPARVRKGVSLVMLSFYETTCSDPAHPRLVRPTATQFAAQLATLGRVFPQARLGMGEIGVQGLEDGLPRNPTLAEKRAVAARYYGMHRELRGRLGRRFVGGYFWWYYIDDAALAHRGQSLWPALDAQLRQLLSSG